MILNSDYRASRKSYGGSKPGVDKRRAPKAIKEAARRWTVRNVAHGDENKLFYSLQGDPRFTPGVFRDLIPDLMEYLPEECEAYFGGTAKHPARWERAANIIANRVHKMYYDTTPSFKGRVRVGNEHPENWSAADRAATAARLDEVGWPW